MVTSPIRSLLPSPMGDRISEVQLYHRIISEERKQHHSYVMGDCRREVSFMIVESDRKSTQQ